MSFGHIIFDCDGVLVDSEPLSMRIDVELLAASGIVMDAAEAHRRFVGYTFAAMVAEVEGEFGVKLPADISARKDARLLALYAEELRPVPGVNEVLAKLAQPKSVASNSPRERVIAALRITGLAQYFGGRITTFEDVAQGKPAPDIYIEAAVRAGHPAARCLVIEDSVAGVIAARQAGCPVFGLTGTHGDPALLGERLLAAGAKAIFTEMAGLSGLIKGML